jgi:Leucine-rich repeat (LRR) protein
LESFDFLSGMPQLTKLSLFCENPISTDYSSLKALKNLTELQFLDSQFGSSNILKILPKLTKIKNLILATTIDQLDFLKNYNDLETLVMASPSTDPVKVDVLAELPKLQTLDISNITLDDVSVLANSQSLRTISYVNSIDRAPVNLSALEEAAPYIDYVEVWR